MRDCVARCFLCRVTQQNIRLGVVASIIRGITIVGRHPDAFCCIFPRLIALAGSNFFEYDAGLLGGQCALVSHSNFTKPATPTPRRSSTQPPWAPLSTSRLSGRITCSRSSMDWIATTQRRRVSSRTMSCSNARARRTTATPTSPC
jgi:hypothetical protein